MSNEIILDTKLVGEIRGDFFVPSYQRGYRWGKDEVERLLNDIYTNGIDNKNYCLQPIVIQNDGTTNTVIDGQQRLTTIYLIYKYMQIKTNGILKGPKYTIDYETRKETKSYLESDIQIDESNIDNYHVYHAFETIDKWIQTFGDKNITTLLNINKFFDESVKVIWYEVPYISTSPEENKKNAIELFTRLNIGKIPLTSAELVKAMFLRTDGKTIYNDHSEEIALQWDNIERELHNQSFWLFLTNYETNFYQTRIDLVLDLIAHKKPNNKDKYAAFFYFDELQKSQNLDVIWAEIQRAFLKLKDWYEDHELYHKIGYLIASKSSSLGEIFEKSEGRKKTEFKSEIDKLIRKSIGNTEDASKWKSFSEMTYENNEDYKKISTLLLLLNVYSVYENGENSQWFPFDKFKVTEKKGSKRKKVVWSLEHIHAQQSQSLKTEQDWRQWLTYHIESLKNIDVDNDELIQEIDSLLNKKTDIGRQKFDELQQKVVATLSTDTGGMNMHTIGNLALLNTNDNAALNNSTFDVKRNEIINLDKSGSYIPYCTKMCFLKYYSPSKNNQLHFWGVEDRLAYIKAINDLLYEKHKILKEPIVATIMNNSDGE